MRYDSSKSNNKREMKECVVATGAAPGMFLRIIIPVF